MSIAAEEQLGFLGHDALAKLIDLNKINLLVVVERHQTVQCPQLKIEVVLAVLNLLTLLKEAEVAVDASLAAKRLKARACAESLRARDAQFADSHLRIEALTILAIGAQVGEQFSLIKGKLF